MKKGYQLTKFLESLRDYRPAKMLFISVGNPSPKFDATRHSAGHLALDYLIKNSGGLSDADKHWDSSIELARLDNHPTVYMAKSLEYMNNSGRAMRSALKQIGHDNRVVVIHDDIDTELGDVKLKLASRQKGAHGGLTSITQHYHEPFARIRIGIGSPPSREAGEVASYVLRKFTPREREILVSESLPKAFHMFSEIVRSMDPMQSQTKKKKTRPPKTSV